MRVHLHTLCWNDLPMLDFFFRHYEPWVDHFYILDDGSDDGTREYLDAHRKVTVEPLIRADPDSWVASALHVYDTDWRRSRGRADWVVVTNIDEHLHHPDMGTYLQACLAKGVTAIPALGYQMIADGFPPHDSILHRTCHFGAAWRNASKLGIFRPDEIEATNFTPGRHGARFEGRVVFPDRDEVLNLHYKYMGLANTRARHRAQNMRLGRTDRRHGWGHKYAWSEAELAADFERVRAAAIDVGAPGVDHHLVHGEPRWWRAP